MLWTTIQKQMTILFATIATRGKTNTTMWVVIRKSVQLAMSRCFCVIAPGDTGSLVPLCEIENRRDTKKAVPAYKQYSICPAWLYQALEKDLA